MQGKCFRVFVHQRTKRSGFSGICLFGEKVVERNVYSEKWTGMKRMSELVDKHMNKQMDEKTNKSITNND